MQTYRDLIVWQKSIEMVKEVYLLVKKLPKEETYALSDQLRRAAVSVPSNIAEGYGRTSTKDYINFLCIARGSKCELETQLIICQELGYLSKDDIKSPMFLCEEIGKMLSGMTNKLKAKTEG